MKWIVIGAVAVLVAAIVWFKPQHLIGVTPTSVSVPVNGTATLSIQLLYKGWFSTKVKPISGTITVSVPQALGSANPLSITTNPGTTRTGTTTITGLAVGTGQIVINGSSRKGTHDTLKIPFTVVAAGGGAGTPGTGGGSGGGTTGGAGSNSTDGG